MKLFNLKLILNQFFILQISIMNRPIKILKDCIKKISMRKYKRYKMGIHVLHIGDSDHSIQIVFMNC